MNAEMEVKHNARATLPATIPQAPTPATVMQALERWMTCVKVWQKELPISPIKDPI